MYFYRSVFIFDLLLKVMFLVCGYKRFRKLLDQVSFNMDKSDKKICLQKAQICPGFTVQSLRILLGLNLLFNPSK